MEERGLVGERGGRMGIARLGEWDRQLQATVVKALLGAQRAGRELSRWVEVQPNRRWPVRSGRGCIAMPPRTV